MVSTHTALALFQHIEPGHPLYPQVQTFAEAIVDHPRFGAIQAQLLRGAKSIVHTELKAGRTSTGGWDCERFYWSVQWWEPAGSLPFRALTLSYAAKDGALRWQSFPDDERLPAMASYFAHAGQGLRADVLRYVPLRRLTVRLARQGETAAIGKFKRRSRLREAYDRLGTIAAAAQQGRASFGVAAPLMYDEARGMFCQQALPGRNLADLIAADNLAGLLGQVGALHHELHSLGTGGLPSAQPDPSLPDLRRDIAWIGYVRPEYARLLERVLHTLAGALPVPNRQAWGCCHGDFVCSQILAGADGWSITDFDLAHHGDPYRELAMLITSLPYDLPLFETRQAADGRRQAAGGGQQSAGAADPTERRLATLLDQAADAYLEGYQAQAGRALDQRRLLWERVRAEIYYLAVALKKDWPQAAMHAATIERIAGLTARLGPRRAP